MKRGEIERDLSECRCVVDLALSPGSSLQQWFNERMTSHCTNYDNIIVPVLTRAGGVGRYTELKDIVRMWVE